MTKGANAASTEEEGQDGSPSLPECCELNADGTISLTLIKPIKVGGEVCPVLTLRKPKAKDLMRLDGIKGDVAKSVMLISISAGIPFTSAQELDGDDLGDAGVVINDFLLKSRLAGEKKQR